MMQKWEYKSLYIAWDPKAKVWQFEYEERTYPSKERIKIMNMLGEEGWELVTTVPFETTSTSLQYTAPSNHVFTEAYLLYFKRPKD
jgi:Domain of unknown function (DUF4177)